MENFKQFNQNWDGIARKNTLIEATIQGATAKGWKPTGRPNAYKVYITVPNESGAVIISGLVYQEGRKFEYSVKVLHDMDDGGPEFEFRKEGIMPSLADAVKESEKMIQDGVDKFLKQHGPALKGKKSGLVGFDQKGLDRIKNWKSQKSS